MRKHLYTCVNLALLLRAPIHFSPLSTLRRYHTDHYLGRMETDSVRGGSKCKILGSPGSSEARFNYFFHEICKKIAQKTKALTTSALYILKWKLIRTNREVVIRIKYQKYIVMFGGLWGLDLV